MEFDDNVFEDLKLLLKQKGFNDAKHFKHNYCYEFYKKSKSANSISVIHLAYSFDKKKISHIASYISFSSVTDILEKFLDVSSDFYDETASNFLYTIESKSNILSLQKISLSSSVELKLLKVKILEHIDSYIIPFFEEIFNLQKLNEKISQVPQSEYCNYIYGESNFKALIIIKLCNNSKYNEFKTWLIGAYKNGISIDAQKYTAGYNIALNIIYYLDSEEYKNL